MTEPADRDGAIGVLDRLLAGAVAGHGRTATVAGTVGTGKTDLLDTFAARVVDHGALAVIGYGSYAERDLPLGVVHQLLHDAPLPADVRDRARRICLPRARAGRSGPLVDGAAPEPLGAALLHEVGTMLLGLSERYPLAIVVDDAHHADAASLTCLSYLARRVRGSNLLILISCSEFDPMQDDLLNGPQNTRLRLGPLTMHDVCELVAARFGAAAGERHAAEWHGLTGGNPLLLAGLIEDFVAEPGDGSRRVVPGSGYGRAVLRAVSRGEPAVLQVARALAISPGEQVATRLLGLDATVVGRVIRSLTTAGILHRGGFRHRAARDALLAQVDADELAALQARTAELAHQRGAPPEVVAEHLRQATPVAAEWAVTALEDSARTALRDGRVDRGLQYLDCARNQCVTPARRATVTALALRARWRISPAMSGTLIDELAESRRRGELSGADAITLARTLLWHGRFDEARAVLGPLAVGSGPDPAFTAELATFQPWLRVTHPPLGSAVPRPPAGGGPLAATVAASRRMTAVTMLAGVLERGPGRGLVAAAQRVLRSVHLDEMSLDTVESALLALVYGGHAAVAAPWCDTFMREARERNAPARQARLASIRAEIAVRLGDPRGAITYARSALDTMPPSSWGVGVGAPLSSLILAATALGDYAEAQVHLDHPVPGGIFQTRSGLLYLRARGRYSLATGDHELALRDFTRCGELMTAWGLDVPGLVAWRDDIDETRLATGEPDAPPAQLAQLAPLAPVTAGPLRLLSDAERRVAELAATGHANREIADKLFVTMSTVEQHLTRIYRKLHVSNRADLPAALNDGSGAGGWFRPES
ncbi:LuxR C-terminal-related transcriptional regulator [Winogradskya humida]|uniref:LuxR family transcriptional regulator n=1 Tax=Winogradskya humida TaxID=113566 RepID=A0ABQ4A5M5_9ACTN|nr:helix-turn-helix transcriptional regulator [Actinoplanes humidus]GIE26151.1 LuxR family transcriptional regulator [Actinoplanes humidus]